MKIKVNDKMDIVASKSLSHIFMIMRDKAIQRRTFYQENDVYSDRTALMQGDHMEMGVHSRNAQPPGWTYQVEEIKYTIVSMEEKIKKLSSLQTNLLRCPSLDDNTEEEQRLNLLANEIKVCMERGQSLLLQVKRGDCEGRELLLNTNVVRSLANSLQEAKNDFVRACNKYTTTVNNIKKSSSFLNPSNDADFDHGHQQGGHSSSSWSHDQLMFLEDNSAMVHEREKSVQVILRSTIDLNQLFKDVAQLVSQQGTLVDQIDFNVERTSQKVYSGADQLRKAERHQRKNRKMMCVMMLAGAVVFFIILLVLTKS